MRAPLPNQLIATYKVFPKELFRVNKGPDISLRAFPTRPKRKFDLLTINGMVKPKALNAQTYIGSSLLRRRQ